MARKPDTPCSRCGKLLWGGSTSLPAGERTCRECRRAGKPITPVRPMAGPGVRRGTVASCRHCGNSFRSKRNAGQTFCSRVCAQTWLHAQPRAITCIDCGATASGTGNARRCKPCGAAVLRARNHLKSARRRGAPKPSTVATARYLGNRDGWRCHLCRRRINPRLTYPHPMSQSVDHLVPVVDGGTNEPNNLALAHLCCNLRRGAGGTVQLMLVG